LEHAPRNPNHAAVFADLDPELHRLPLDIPAGVLGNDGWEAGLFALSCSLCGRQRNTHLGRLDEMTHQNHFADEVIE
jgi:hypothetical protein